MYWHLNVLLANPIIQGRQEEAPDHALTLLKWSDEFLNRDIGPDFFFKLLLVSV